MQALQSAHESTAMCGRNLGMMAVIFCPTALSWRWLVMRRAVYNAKRFRM